MHHLLAEIGFTLVAAMAMGLLSFWLKQPVLVGYLLAGVALGPQMGFGLIESAESIEVISEIGLVLLLFIIGLEMNLKELMSSGKLLLVAGLAQFPICVAIGVGVFLLAGYTIDSVKLDAVYLALCAAISSTAIVVKILYDKRELKTGPGRLTLGVLVFQDIFAILVLGLQKNLANPSIMPLVEAIAASAALFFIAYLMSRFVLGRVFNSISHTPELVLTVSIGWCAALAMVAQALGVSKEMGALVAGVAIASFPYSLHVTAKILPIRDFFITLFFVSLGMRIPALPSSLIPVIGLLCAVVLLSRFISLYPVIALLGGGRRVAFVTSLNLSQISEFSLVIAALGLKLGHIQAETLTVIIYSMAILAVFSSYAIRFNHPLYQVWTRIMDRLVSEKELENRDNAPLEEHHDIAILGCHQIGKALVEELVRTGSPLVSRLLVIDFNPLMLRSLRSLGVQARFGDIGSLDTLEHAHVSNAQIILSSIPDMLLKGVSNAAIVRSARALSPSACIIATADDSFHEQFLREAGANIVISPFDLSGVELSRQLEQLSRSVEAV